MIVVAVGTVYLIVCARFGLAVRDVLSVEGGEVVACTGTALRGSGSTDVSRMPPLKTSGALASCGGNGPLLASPDDACK